MTPFFDHNLKNFLSKHDIFSFLSMHIRKDSVRNTVNDFRPTDYFTLDENEIPSHASSSDYCGLSLHF